MNGLRRTALAGWCLLVLLLPAFAAAPKPPEPGALAAFAQQLALHDVAGFIETVEELRNNHRLPPRYVMKEIARARGWHGGGLCGHWPGHVIGGDAFHNFAARLPDAPGRTYYEADLDGDCRSRGPKRLVFSNDGLIFVTVDHYNTFVPVP